MPFPFRFFRTWLPVRTGSSALGALLVLGSLTGTSAQAPVALPAVRTESAPGAQAPMAVPAARTQGAPAAGGQAIPSTAKPPEAAPTGDSTQSAMQVVDMLATLSRFDQDGRA